MEVDFTEEERKQIVDGCWKHKEGCLWQDNVHHGHRVPIDCVTADDLLERIADAQTKINDLEALVKQLKARIYDFEHGGDE